MSDTTIPRPTSDDRDEWNAYWTTQGEPWRTEPEISPERQRELAERRDTIKPDINKGIYPFKDVRLLRAEIEWLLHEHGPIDWSDETQRARDGLDLRGALLNRTAEDATADLSALPLACTRFGLEYKESLIATIEQVEQATAHLEGTKLHSVHLEGAKLGGTHLEGAKLGGGRDFMKIGGAYLEEAYLSFAHLEKANLRDAHLERASLDFAYLEKSILSDAHLEHASLVGAHLEGATLNRTSLERATLYGAYLNRAILGDGAHLEGANLGTAILEGADLHNAFLEGADLSYAHLEGTILRYAHLEGKTLLDADYQRIVKAGRGDSHSLTQHLSPANLRGAFFSGTTQITGINLGKDREAVQVADVNWSSGSTVNLSIVETSFQTIEWLGDEVEARKIKDEYGSKKDRYTSIDEWRTAIRAYRQIAIALRSQGMNEVADKFSYRAQICHRRLLRLQRRIGGYLWSNFLAFLAGYGYAPSRTLLAYLGVIITYAYAFFFLGRSEVHQLSLLGAVIFSITSFHGRGFFPGGLALDDPLTVIAASEAIIGLLIEASFIATFTQRFFSR